jgi:hypothetical protein
MRRDVAPDLEHDLGAALEPEAARVAAPRDSADEHGDGASERRQPVRPERLTPDPEEPAEPRPAAVVDDAARIESPDAGATARGDDPAKPEPGMFEPDRRRHDHDPPLREELDVYARPLAQRRGAAGEARGRRRSGRVVAGPGPNRDRHEPQQGGGYRERKRAGGHLRQAMRALLCLLACAVAAGLAASSARADGDPASDYLIGQQVFLSYDAKIPPAAQQKLVAAVASANRNGFPIRVALIWSRYDLGSVPELFRKPRTYARFLDAEDSKCWWGGSCGSGRFKTTTRLLVVMPNGLGFAQWKHNPASGYRTLAGITVDPTPTGLAAAATTAVVKLAAAAGVRVTTSGSTTPTTAASGGGSSRIEIIVAVLAALLLGIAARLLIRRRAARSTVR